MTKEATSKKGNKPIAVVRDKGCAVSVFQNENTVKGQPTTVYKFTFARTYRKGRDFVTAYSFRVQDLGTLQRLIDDARNAIEDPEASGKSKSHGE